MSFLIQHCFLVMPSADFSGKTSSWSPLFLLTATKIHHEQKINGLKTLCFLPKQLSCIVDMNFYYPRTPKLLRVAHGLWLSGHGVSHSIHKALIFTSHGLYLLLNKAVKTSWQTSWWKLSDSTNLLGSQGFLLIFLFFVKIKKCN